MEVTSCVKALISASDQYKLNPSDEIFSYLIRQLDVLISISSKGMPLTFFNPRELLFKECLASLAAIISDNQTKSLLALKTLNLLNNLANSEDVCNMLRNSFDLCCLLLNYFKFCLSSSLEANLAMCLRLLQKLTYKSVVVAEASKLEELVVFLLNQLESPESEMTQCCLGLLANLTWRTTHVQSFIKSRENIKAILKKLMGYMSHINQKIEILSVTTLSNLCLHDEVGKKIFAGQNLSQMIQLLFNILHNNKPNTTRQCAVDLFVSILQNERVQKHLVEYEYLDRCLQIVINNVSLECPQNSSANGLKIIYRTESNKSTSTIQLQTIVIYLVDCCKDLYFVYINDLCSLSNLLEFLLYADDTNVLHLILELLVSFSTVEELRTRLCSLIFSDPACQDVTANLENFHQKSCFFFVLASMVSLEDFNTNAGPCVSLLSVDLLTSLYLDTKWMGNKRFDILVPSLLNVLSLRAVSSSSDRITLRQLRIIKLLKILCNKEESFQLIRRLLNINACVDLLNVHINSFNSNMLSLNLSKVNININNCTVSSTSAASSYNNQSSDVFEDPVVELVLQLVDFLLKFLPPDGTIKLILEDPRFIPFIVKGMTALSRDCVEISFRLLTNSVRLRNFPFHSLVDTMTATNIQLQQHQHQQPCEWSSTFPFPSNRKLPTTTTTTAIQQSNIEIIQTSLPPSLSSSSLSSFSHPDKRITAASPSSEINSTVTGLIEKLRNNFEIKDIKTSEVIGLYEYKLQSVHNKENLLQGLLDAKTEALNQSDRVLSQFRLRLVQHETESQKLRLLLMETERCKDELNEQVYIQSSKLDVLQNEYENLEQENARLTEIERKFKVLTVEYAEISQRLEVCQRSLDAMSQDYQSLKEMDDMLKKRHETLRNQHEIQSSKLLEVEEEKSSLAAELKDRTQKNSELTKSLAQCEVNLKKKSSECNELECAVDKLRNELSKAEQAKKDLKHQVSSLELLYQQRESSIKEKDILIQQQKAELDKHAQIAALIHNLSGGKLPTNIPPV